MNLIEKPVIIIAEVGSVHDGSFGNAKNLITLSEKIGADIVKFQTHIAEIESLQDAPNPPYFIDENRIDYFERTGFKFEEWKELKKVCRQHGVEFMSSPFSQEAVEILEKLEVACYKIPSGEVTNLSLLRHVAETGKPMFLSSGMSNWDELDKAVNTILNHHSKLTVLQCTSMYPCPSDKIGLNVMLEMKERYQIPVGLSDHSMSNYSAFAAVALGASVIEKHLTFSREMYGTDASNSLEPDEFGDLVVGIRAIETMLHSKVDKDYLSQELSEMKAVFEKSIVSIVDVPEDSILTREMLGLKKPGNGLPSSELCKVIGKRAKNDIPKDSLIRIEDIKD
tara:strand:- start:1289 stop:2302 length:1014 start_codon:yes stop_codon:yes gene_type:complete